MPYTLSKGRNWKPEAGIEKWKYIYVNIMQLLLSNINMSVRRNFLKKKKKIYEENCWLESSHGPINVKDLLGVVK